MTTFVELYHPALPGVPHVRAATQAVSEYEARGWIRVDGSTPAPEAIYLTPGVGDLRYTRLGAADLRLTVASTVTADATLAVGKHTPVDATVAALTQTLPTGAAAGDRISVEKIDTSTHAVTVSGSIRGSAGTVTLVGQFETLALIADSSGSWHPVAGHKTKAWLDSKYGAATLAVDPALRAAFVPFWTAAETVTTGTVRVDSTGHLITANSNRTTRGTYDATEQAAWTVVSGGGGASLPTQTGNAGKFLTTDGTTATWGTPAGGGTSLTVQATTTTAGALVPGKHNPVDATAGTKAMTLPTGQTAGTLLSVEKTDTTTNAVTVTGSVRGVGATTITLVWPSEAVLLVADAAGSWWVAAGHKTKASLDATYAARAQARVAGSVLPGPPVTTINACPYTTGTNSSATGQTARNTYLVPAACTDLRLVWFGWYVTSSGEQALAQQVTFKAAIEYNGTILPVTMGGTRSLTIDPWGTCISDPIGLDLPAGATFSVRAFMNTPTSSQPFPQTIGSGGGVAISPTGDGYATGDVVDSGAMTNANASRFNLWLPAAVCGRPIGNGLPVIALVGDSITRGGATSFGELGSGYSWGWRGLNGGFPSINLGVPSELVQSAAAATGYARRATLLPHCKYAIVLYGTNDFAAGRTAVQIEADLTTVYTRLASRGLTVYGATLPPKTTSTDSWATTGNQTVTANEAVRVAVNTWIRTTPAPLAGYFETADTVESARNSGLWKVDGTANKWTVDGTHPSQTGHAAMGAAITTALFV